MEPNYYRDLTWWIDGDSLIIADYEQDELGRIDLRDKQGGIVAQEFAEAWIDGYKRGRRDGDASGRAVLQFELRQLFGVPAKEPTP